MVMDKQKCGKGAWAVGARMTEDYEEYVEKESGKGVC